MSQPPWQAVASEITGIPSNRFVASRQLPDQDVWVAIEDNGTEHEITPVDMVRHHARMNRWFEDYERREAEG